MKDSIAQIRRHFDSKGFRRIDIPEWCDEAGKPLSIYYEPLTVKVKDHLKGLHDDMGDSVEWLVAIIIHQAKDASGEKMFDVGDKQSFMTHADPAVIERVATAIMMEGGDVATEKKN